MARIYGVVSVPSVNYYSEIRCVPEYQFSLTLNKDCVYDIGIDQSSSCTGIAIISTDKRIRIIMDCMRDTGDREEFYRQLYRILKNLVHGQKIRHVVCETPPPVQGKQYTSRILLELLGRLSAWIEEIPELRNAEFGKIFPQSWKPFVVDTSKGKGRDKIKACIAEDICDILPEFDTYRERHVSRDYDAFDACGILLGYLAYSYDASGYRMISGVQEKRHTSFVGYRYISIDELKEKGAVSFMGLAVKEANPIFLSYNERYNKFNNIRMASSNNVACYTFLEDKYLDELKWQYDLEPKDDYVLIMYIFNESKLSKSFIKVLKSLFPMHEEVQNV